MMRLLILTSLLGMVGCSHSIHQVHAGDYDLDLAKVKDQEVVEARAEQWAFMGAVSDTNYVDEAYLKLQSKCKGGRIHGITTQLSTSHGPFSWTNKVLMQGYCIKSDD